MHDSFLLINLNYNQNILIFCVQKDFLHDHVCKYKKQFLHSIDK